ncbi:MAG: diaminopimelate epimerase [Planctomycetia bacterium TMED53]|nr:MAG: diaminopimelate epimerase [Planctomycetia bacterium TMED53]
MNIRTLPFLKAHGAGNDFVVLDEEDGQIPPELTHWSRVLCCRRTGIGADGVLVIRRSAGVIAMECWNSDGSRAEACGNGLRVIARVLYLREVVSTIHTDAGPVAVESTQTESGDFIAKTILGPITIDEEVNLDLHGEIYCGTPANVGNPHLVFALADFNGEDPVRQLGPSLEFSVPGRVNVGFYSVESKDLVHLRVWERGCGETLACGTGAAAAVRVLQAQGVIGPKVEVRMPGGALQIQSVEKTPELLEISGPARINFSGMLHIDPDKEGPTEFDLQFEGCANSIKS